MTNRSVVGLHRSAMEPVRVACLGDSITAGEKVDAATEPYPACLQMLLGTNCVVKNFGRGGASFWHGGNPNAAQQLPGAAEFAPQVAIVMFGINDTRNRDVPYWAHFDEFEADAAKVLDTLIALPTRPRVLLCVPTANFADLDGMSADRRGSVAERLPRLELVRAKIVALAASHAQRGVTLVDLHAATKNRRELIDPDGVHLNAAGYRLLAERLAPEVLRTASL